MAAGKAAGVMMRTALDAGLMIERGLIVSTHWQGEWPASIATIKAGHPIPTDASEAAGRAALELARGAAADESLVVLLSGGASALLCAPADGVTLADKQATTRLLLEAGASIDELNAVRKHLSAVKGGGLAAAARCEVVTFALSDVVGPRARRSRRHRIGADRAGCIDLGRCASPSSRVAACWRACRRPCANDSRLARAARSPRRRSPAIRDWRGRRGT